MTNIEALKSLFVALGGDEADFDATTNAEAIALIATVAAGSSGSGLPAVTAADNGRVLKVVDGEWALGTDLTE